MSRLIITIVSICLIVVPLMDIQASNLPRSKQATLIESVSPAEVTVRATGIGYWKTKMSKKKDMENFLLKSAEDDARKAAVYFVLHGGTDPLIKQDEEKASFAKIQEEFFDRDNILQFITWEGSELLSRTKRTIKKKKEYELHIEKAYKINKQGLQTVLVDRGILISRAELTDLIGLPFIMVLPAVKKGQNPIQLMQSDANLSHAAKVIEGYLTQKQYDVVVPEQQVSLSELSAAQQSLKDVEEDYSYQLALSIGSDVYITYEVNISNEKLGTKKAIISVRAYETTTARLLGTETGYSPAAKVAEMALIENAVNDGIDKVLSRINAYWKEDVGRGLQYKIIVSISTDFDEDEAEEISFAFADILEEIAKNKKYKENIVTDQTLDYLVWCDPEMYDKSTKVYRKIKKTFGNEFDDGVLKKVNINRKLILLKVESE